MTRFSEEWYDRKQANVAEWKRREAARANNQRAKANNVQKTTTAPRVHPTASDVVVGGVLGVDKQTNGIGLRTGKGGEGAKGGSSSVLRSVCWPNPIGDECASQVRQPEMCQPRPPVCGDAERECCGRHNKGTYASTNVGVDPAARAGVLEEPTPIYPLVGLCRAACLPEPVPEYRWHPVRRYRADYALPLHHILIEIDGGLWVNGGHSRGAARMHDMAKDRAATMLGWRTLRYAPSELVTIIADLRILLAGD